MEEIKECMDKLLLVITQLQDLAKQHNKMFLDLYERLSKLEQLHEGGAHRKGGDKHE